MTVQSFDAMCVDLSKYLNKAKVIEGWTKHHRNMAWCTFERVKATVEERHKNGITVDVDGPLVRCEVAYTMAHEALKKAIVNYSQVDTLGKAILKACAEGSYYTITEVFGVWTAAMQALSITAEIAKKASNTATIAASDVIAALDGAEVDPTLGTIAFNETLTVMHEYRAVAVSLKKHAEEFKEYIMSNAPIISLLSVHSLKHERIFLAIVEDF